MSADRRHRLALLAMIGSCACAPNELLAARPSMVADIEVVRGPFEQRLELTGEVDAAVSIQLSGPRTEDWNLAIRWLAEDGTQVHAGDRVIGFDNVAVADRLRELERAVVEAGSAANEQAAKDAVANADKAFEVEKQRTAVAKAELDATVPAQLLSRREAQNFALALARSEVAFATATADLRAAESGSRLEAQVKQIAYDKAVRRLAAAGEQLHSLDVYAPRDGVVLVGTHPWEGRKLQVGDNVWPGLTIARLPDLSEMVVQARLDDVDDGRIHAGMAVRCFVDAFSDRPLRGHIVAVSPVAQEIAQLSTRRYFTVRIALDETDAEVLRPGLSVRAEVITRVIDDALLVPRSALDLLAQPPRARTVDGRELELELEACDPQRCAVRSGLSEGDRLRGLEEAG
jgi:HlyD family secretion protein